MRSVVLTVDVIVHENLELYLCYAVRIFERLIQYHEVEVHLMCCEVRQGAAFFGELTSLHNISNTYDAEF